MKVLYLDLSMGAAGDMLTAALYELLDDDQKQDFLDKINSLGIDGVSVCASTSEKSGIVGTHMDVRIDGISEHEHVHAHEHEHEHEHEHGHERPHSHIGMESIIHTVSSMPLSENVKNDIKSVYDLIAAAEGTVHGKSVDLIHFHEVGDKDAIVDVAAVSLLMEMHSFDRVYASPVCTGYGKVKCAHGILPVPAPATAEILKGIPIYEGRIEAELCTPTGAALCRHFVDEFGPQPILSVDSIGYGMGTRDLETANCIRAYLAQTSDRGDDIIELSCNVDDMTPESIGYATSVLLENGARDVYTVCIGMKKNRPGVMINVLCKPEDSRKFAELMFRHTSTLGIRENHFRRYTLERENGTFASALGDVRFKRSEGYGIKRNKYEYDDVCLLARQEGMSFDETVKQLDGELYARYQGSSD